MEEQTKIKETIKNEFKEMEEFRLRIEITLINLRNQQIRAQKTISFVENLIMKGEYNDFEKYNKLKNELEKVVRDIQRLKIGYKREYRIANEWVNDLGLMKFRCSVNEYKDYQKRSENYYDKMKEYLEQGYIPDNISSKMKEKLKKSNINIDDSGMDDAVILDSAYGNCNNVFSKLLERNQKRLELMKSGIEYTNRITGTELYCLKNGVAMDGNLVHMCGQVQKILKEIMPIQKEEIAVLESYINDDCDKDMIKILLDSQKRDYIIQTNLEKIRKLWENLYY